MSESTEKKSVPKLRTFASDLIFAQENKVTPLPKTITENTPEQQITPTTNNVPNELEDAIKDALAITSKTIKGAGEENEENIDSTDATIITDTKHKRFRALPAIGNSLKGWFSTQKKNNQKKHTPTYSVPEASLRKGVIQKATSKTGKATTADFATIQARIKRRKNLETKDTSKNASTEVTVQESLEPVFYKKPASKENTPVVHNIQNVKILAHNETKNKPTEPETTTGVSGFESPEYLALVENEDMAQPKPDNKIENKSADTSETEIEVRQTSPSIYKVPITNNLNIVNLIQKLLSSTNGLTVVVSTIAVAIIVIGITFIIHPKSDDSLAVEIISKPTILNNSEINDAVITTLTKDSLANAMTTERVEVDRLTEISFNLAGKNLTTNELFYLINPNTDLAFAHAIKLINFGYSSEKVPFIVMTFTDKTAIQGGMFLWEKTILNDISNIFKIAYNAKDGSFTDIQINGIDARVYTDSSGNEILIYGIVGSTIIITTDRLTLASIIPLSK